MRPHRPVVQPAQITLPVPFGNCAKSPNRNPAALETKYFETKISFYPKISSIPPRLLLPSSFFSENLTFSPISSILNM